MANLKISQLTVGVPLSTDIIPYVDLVSGETKKTLVSSISGSSGLVTGTTTITGGTNGKILYNNNGVLGELTNNFLTSLAGALLATGATTGATSQTQVFTNTLQITALTASKLVFTDASKNLTSTGIGTSSQFIKGDGSLDSNTYLTSLSGAVLTDQSTPQTIGATGARLLKLWATDITVTNAITGSITGNAGTVTNGLYTTNIGSTVQAYSASLASLAGLTYASTSFVKMTAAGTFSLDTSVYYKSGDSPTFGTITTTGGIELGNASDTTLSRSAAGVLAVEGVVIPSISSTNTLTNKRITPRVLSATSYTTDTGTSLNCDTLDQFIVTAQAGALKFNNPGGTPVNGNKLIIRIKDNGTARALTYDTQFRAVGVTLPTTTVLSKILYMGFIYNSDETKWDCVAVAQEA